MSPTQEPVGGVIAIHTHASDAWSLVGWKTLLQGTTAHSKSHRARGWRDGCISASNDDAKTADPNDGLEIIEIY